MDYGMKDGSIRMRVRAAVAGYMLLRWSVDCSPDHSLREEQYRLWLSDPLALYGVENAKLAPGYRLPAVAARCVCAPAPRDAQRDIQVALAHSVSAGALFCACALRLRHGRGRPAVERCALSARTKRSPHTGWTAFRVSLQAAFGHPPGPYASRGLLASVLRTFPGSQRSSESSTLTSRHST